MDGEHRRSQVMVDVLLEELPAVDDAVCEEVGTRPTVPSMERRREHRVSRPDRAQTLTGFPFARVVDRGQSGQQGARRGP